MGPDFRGQEPARRKRYIASRVLACRLLFHLFPAAHIPLFLLSSHHRRPGTSPWPYPSFGDVYPGRQVVKCISALYYAVQTEIIILLMSFPRAVMRRKACRTPWFVGLSQLVRPTANVLAR